MTLNVAERLRGPRKNQLLTCEREKPKTFCYTGQSLKHYLDQIQMTRAPATIP